MKIIDYDRIDEWGTWFGATIAEIAPKDVGEAIANARPRYLEDAGALVCDTIGLSRLVGHLTSRLRSDVVRVYHGSRLSDDEAESIRAEGLKPLVVVDRKARLADIFSQHPKWGNAKEHLDDALRAMGPGQYAGRREDGSVHVCFSRAGLLHGCNHYLVEGPEVDGHIAYRLFRDKTGLELLRRARRPMLVSFLAPFPDALRAANPDDCRDDELPSLLAILVNAWAFKQANPAFTVASQRDCTAARFEGRISAETIEAIVEIDDAELEGDC